MSDQSNQAAMFTLLGLGTFGIRHVILNLQCRSEHPWSISRS